MTASGSIADWREFPRSWGKPPYGFQDCSSAQRMGEEGSDVINRMIGRKNGNRTECQKLVLDLLTQQDTQAAADD